MTNEVVTIWGGQPRFGRAPASGETLAGDSNGNLKLITAPAFRAYLSGDQAVTPDSTTLVNINTIVFQTASSGFSTTTSVFTPTIAGYYQITGCLYSTWGGGGGISARLFKNGVLDSVGPWAFTSPGPTAISTLVYLNGTTDYVDFRGRTLGTTPIFNGYISTLPNFFSAVLVAPA